MGWVVISKFEPDDFDPAQAKLGLIETLQDFHKAKLIVLETLEEEIKEYF